MTIKRLITFLYFIIFTFLLSISCVPFGECTHHFIFQGKIDVNDSLLKDNLVIKYENLGNIIFKLDNKYRDDTSIVNKNGYYKIYGDFFTTCASDKKAFDDSDSIGFEILHKGQLIKTGKFKILQLDRYYTDSAYQTTLKLPTIKLE